MSKPTLGNFLALKTGRGMAIGAFIIIFPVLIAMLLSFLGLPVRGFEWVQGEQAKEVTTEAKVPTVVDYTKTPAGEVMDKFFQDLQGKWQAGSTVVHSAGLPHPLDCVTPAPSLSDSQAFQADGMDVQVTFAAYPAGVGAESYRRLKDETIDCKPSDTAIYPAPVNDLGVEAHTLTTYWASNGIETTVYRRGDVLIFVASAASQDPIPAARITDRVLKKYLTKEVCYNETSGLRAQLRNAFFSGDDFTGLEKIETLTTQALPNPVIPEELATTGVKETSLPARSKKLEEVQLPATTDAYPLWPELPKPVKKPKKPAVPADQKISDTATVRMPDDEGPGCGWAFLTTVEPTYDTEAIDAENKRLLAAVQVALDADGPRWQAEVLEYWTSWATYRKEVRAYRAYSEEVRLVANAWNLIHADWSRYYTAHANWEVNERNRKAFLAAQETAREQWPIQKQACKDYGTALKVYEQELSYYEEWTNYYEENPLVWQATWDKYLTDLEAWQKDTRPEEEKGPEPTDPTPLEPAKPAKPEHACPVVKPAILDQDAPEKKPEPKKPADPRPADARN